MDEHPTSHDLKYNISLQTKMLLCTFTDDYTFTFHPLRLQFANCCIQVKFIGKESRRGHVYHWIALFTLQQI